MVDMLRKSVVALLLVLVATYVPCYALQGTWGSLTWQLSKDSTVLIISGTGHMKTDYSYPWSKFRRKVKTLVLSEGVKNVAAYAFLNFAQLSTQQYIRYRTESFFRLFFFGICEYSKWCYLFTCRGFRRLL